MLIKICGLTNVVTANQVALSGADYIGLIFSSVSPRQINLELAQEITNASRKAGAVVVGVFVDETLEEVLHIIKTLELKVIQLHGDTVRQYCETLKKTLLYIQIIYVVNDYNNIPDCLDTNEDFLLFDKVEPVDTKFRFFVAGYLNADNVNDAIKKYQPNGVDVSSGVEATLAKKDINKVQTFIKNARQERYGRFGGKFVPELLITPLNALEHAYLTIAQSQEFKTEYQNYLSNYLGRPTPITEVKTFAKSLKSSNTPRVFLKREDLLHTGAHKINNAVGQCLLAKKMGKTRIIAETGAGQHGLATATACAMFNLECVIYMGSIDVERQSPNVAKMKLLGAKVVLVGHGSKTLKDAVNEALRDWAENYEYSHYCLGSALGPHPFPKIVADFQSVIGNEAIMQMTNNYNIQPNTIIACVGGGSNAIGIFNAFLNKNDVNLIGIEAGGRGSGLGNNAARFTDGRIGVLHGTKTYVLQDENNQIVDTYSISAGLDYPGVGPQHSYLFATGRANYSSVTDDEAIQAFKLLIKTEGIIPALESSHALAYLVKNIDKFNQDDVVLINLSGRGDKDLPQLLSGGLINVE